jgi:hypothetical protein
MYDAAGIKSVSPSNPLVAQYRLNDHQRWIVVQSDSDHDLCTGGSYAKAMVVLTSTQASRPLNRQWTCTADSRVEVQGDGAGDHYIGGWCAHTTVLIASTQADHKQYDGVSVYPDSRIVLQYHESKDLITDGS